MLLQQEWRKLSCQRLFKVLIGSVLALQTALLIWAGQLPHAENSILYRQALSQAARQMDLQSLLDTYEQEERALLDRNDIFDLQSGLFNDEALGRYFFQVVIPIQSHLSRIIEFPNTIQSRLEQIDKKLLLPMYAQTDSYAAAALRRQRANYHSLSGLKLRVDFEKSFHMLASLQATDLLLIIALFILSAQVFGADREHDMTALVSAQPQSIRVIALSRLILIMLLGLALTLFIWCFSLAYMGLVYGFGQLSRPLQSISLFALCDIPISAASFLARLLLMKCCAALALAAVCSLVMALSKSTTAQYMLFVLVAGGSYIMWALIPANSIGEALKGFNLFGLLDVFWHYRGVSFMRVFKWPVSRFHASIAVSLLFSFLGFSGAWFILGEEKPENRHKAQSRVMLPGIKTLGMIEGGRLLLSQGGLLAIALLLAIAGFTIQKTPETHYMKQREYYLDYFLSLRGRLTENTLVKAEGIAQSFQAEIESFSDKQSDDQEAAVQQSMLQGRQEAFLRLKNQIDASSVYLNTAFWIEVLDEKTGDFWFRNQTADAVYGGLGTAGMLIVGMAVCWQDRRYQMLQLLCSTSQGHYKVLRIRIRLILCCAIFLAIGLSIPHWISAQGQNRLLPLQAAVQSAPNLLHFGPVISFGWLSFLLLLYRMLNLFLQGAFFLFIVLRFPGIWPALMAGTLFFVLPQFLAAIFPFFEAGAYFIFSNSFLISSALAKLHAAGLLLFFLLSILSCVAVWLALVRVWRAPVAKRRKLPR